MSHQIEVQHVFDSVYFMDGSAEREVTHITNWSYQYSVDGFPYPALRTHQIGVQCPQKTNKMFLLMPFARRSDEIRAMHDPCGE